jgi:hypothetical protein
VLRVGIERRACFELPGFPVARPRDDFFFMA